MTQKANRLINSASPYLRQHAYNPVDWYPWGEEAIRKAIAEDKPILLSIGYSSCHWCHVMAHEVFENPEIAALINSSVVPVKVDREERPDLDKTYMNFVQIAYGSGGWPLNVFVTPKLIPFFGGTYFPPEDAVGVPGFKTVLQKVNDYYQEKKNLIKQQGDYLAAKIGELMSFDDSEEILQKEDVPQIIEKIRFSMDKKNGGLGRKNKFPQVPILSFLLQHSGNNQEISQIVKLTLDNMANRGLYDQIGGGFHRYCVDPEWRIPHFEKMLYDNALVSSLFLEAYQLWGTYRYLEVVHETLEFVLREMTHPEGGFYSSIDADSEGREGKFYVWKKEEIENIIGKIDAGIFCEYYGVKNEGNFKGREFVLNVSWKIADLAKKHHLLISEVKHILKEGKNKLLEYRANRVSPGMDNKIITAWNSMMINTFASAYLVLGYSRYLKAAEDALNFIESNMQREGKFYRLPVKGRNVLNGYLSDYAYLIKAYITLFEATSKFQYLNKAESLCSTAIENFWDATEKAFFFTSHDHERAFMRVKDIMDESVPSSNSIMAHNLLRLYTITSKKSYHETAINLLKNFGAAIKDNPVGAASWLLAYQYYWNGNQQLILIGFHDKKSDKIFQRTNKKYLPNKVFFRLEPEEENIPQCLAVHKSKKMLDNQPTLYVCQNFTCLAPLNDQEQITTCLNFLH